MSVDTIRDIPVIVERSGGCRSRYEPMDLDNYDSGFPFDQSGRRARDPLEDIAQRHPEFAQHLQGFPRRTQRTAAADPETDEFLRRRFEHPFASGRFERFGFPFDRADFEREPQRYYEAYPEHFQNFQNQQPQSPSSHNQQQQQPQGYQQHPPQYSQEYQPQHSQEKRPPQYQSQSSQSVSQGTQTDQCEEEPPVQQQQPEDTTDSGSQENRTEGQTRGRPIQQSNTCDLSEHQPPDEALNERGQRSMSAPPENKRFTSSVNIPMGGHQESNGAGAKSQAAGSGSTERVIPIHVEGRDDPVVPKHFAGSTQSQPQPERIFSDSPRPQTETIFGRRPEAFTQFVNRDPHRFQNDWPHSFGGFPEEEFGFRRTESPTRFGGAKPQQQQQQQQHRPEAAAPTAQAQPPKQQQPQQQPQQQEQKQEPAAQQQPQPPKQPAGPIEQIQAIQKDVATLLRQVEAFNGQPRDKNYLYLDEMLTRNLLKLDNVDTQGQDSIRSARKEAIKSIERTISLLESRAAANAASKGEKMEVEQEQQTTVQGTDEKMETEPASNSEPSVNEAAAAAASQTEPMDAAAASTAGEEAVDQSKSEEQSKSEPEQQPKSDEPMEGGQGEAKKEEVKIDEVAPVVESNTASQTDETAVQDTAKADNQTENKEGGEKEDVKEETKTGEKKEKKKTKKKVSKEDKEKKQ